jgi:predicted RecA/RadA family phage recombinase
MEIDMKNFIQPGKMIGIIAAADTLSGAGVKTGVLFGVAAHDALSGEPLEIAADGVFELQKATGTAWTVGAAIYWNGTACTVAATAGNLLIGCAVIAAASGDTLGTVRLNGAVPAAVTA